MLCLAVAKQKDHGEVKLSFSTNGHSEDPECFLDCSVRSGVTEKDDGRPLHRSSVFETDSSTSQHR